MTTAVAAVAAVVAAEIAVAVAATGPRNGNGKPPVPQSSGAPRRGRTPSGSEGRSESSPAGRAACSRARVSAG